MKYRHKNMAVTEEQLKSGELAVLLDSGWELVSMAPYVMQPREGQTYVSEYWVTLRQPANQS